MRHAYLPRLDQGRGQRQMTFVITYCDPSHANSAGVTVADSEPAVREAIERLRREGYEVTRIAPPIEKHTPSNVSSR
jgi:hypothetical protein